MFLILYELKYIRYINISGEAFFIFFITYIGIITGALTVLFARNVFFEENNSANKIQIRSILFEDNFKILRIIIIFVSLIGLYSAYQNWSYLLNKFGSFTAIMLRAHTIYRMRIAGELDGGTPYLSILPYAGVILSGIYTATKSKISIYSILPLISIVISDIASVGRGGIFVGFIMLGTSFLLFRNILPNVQNQFFTQNKKALVLGGIVLVALVLGSLSLVSELRGRFEAFKGKTRAFSKFDDIPFVSASEYFYFSSNVGVFSKYFEKQDENTMIGENTFLPIHNLLSKFGLIEHPQFYPKGYNIPNWSNAATYLRDLHADFGIVGMLFFPYLLSLLTTFFWFRFYRRGDLISFICLTYLFVIISFSAFNMQTRSAFFLISFLVLIIFIKSIEIFSKKLLINENY
jgi:oligosaccharide repeat unit polymerase